MFGLEIDSFVESLPFALLGLALLVGVAHLLGLMARLSRRLADGAARDRGAGRRQVVGRS